MSEATFRKESNGNNWRAHEKLVISPDSILTTQIANCFREIK